MPLRIEAWDRWQGQFLKGVRSKRVERGTDARRPYGMTAIAVAASFDDRHAEFARAFRNSEPDAFFLRVLQYVGLHSPFDGCCHVPREAFGPVVLTRSYNVVSVQKGKRVWDALLDSGIARIVTPEEATRLRHVADAESTSPASRARSGSGSGSGEEEPPNPTETAGRLDLPCPLPGCGRRHQNPERAARCRRKLERHAVEVAAKKPPPERLAPEMVQPIIDRLHALHTGNPRSYPLASIVPREMAAWFPRGLEEARDYLNQHEGGNGA